MVLLSERWISRCILIVESIKLLGELAVQIRLEGTIQGKVRNGCKALSGAQLRSLRETWSWQVNIRRVLGCVIWFAFGIFACFHDNSCTDDSFFSVTARIRLPVFININDGTFVCVNHILWINVDDFDVIFLAVCINIIVSNLITVDYIRILGIIDGTLTVSRVIILISDTCVVVILLVDTTFTESRVVVTAITDWLLNRILIVVWVAGIVIISDTCFSIISVVVSIVVLAISVRVLVKLERIIIIITLQGLQVNSRRRYGNYCGDRIIYFHQFVGIEFFMKFPNGFSYKIVVQNWGIYVVKSKLENES